MQNFRALGTPPSDLKSTPPLRISGYAPGVEGENLKSHAMTSLDIFEKKDFLWNQDTIKWNTRNHRFC